MSQRIKYFPVNWADGMKLNKSHFQTLDASFADRLRDTTEVMLKNFEFGLLPPFDTNKVSLELNISDGKIVLSTCRAVTANGTRIEIYQMDRPELTASIDGLVQKELLNEGRAFYVILTINPFSGLPAGEPDPEEIPPRLPYLIPACTLSLVPVEEVTVKEFATYHLPIGKLIYRASEFKQDSAYIPPCNRIDAFPQLKQKYLDMGKLLNSLEINALNVVQRSRDAQKKGEFNYLADSIHFFAKEVLNFQTRFLTQYHLFINQQAPIYLLDFFIRMAKTIHVAWESIKSRDKEEMLSYFKDHAGYSPNELEQELRDIIQLNYRHIDVSPLLESIYEFLIKMERLFERLTHLNYIPQSKHGLIQSTGIESKSPQSASSSKSDHTNKGGIFR